MVLPTQHALQFAHTTTWGGRTLGTAAASIERLVSGSQIRILLSEISEGRCHPAAEHSRFLPEGQAPITAVEATCNRG